jgi:hypothetical protein
MSFASRFDASMSASAAASAPGGGASSSSPSSSLWGWLGGSGAAPSAPSGADLEEGVPLTGGGLSQASAAAAASITGLCGSLSYAERVRYFIVLALTGSFFIFLALFVFLPMVVLFPSKFALCFTLGSLCFMGSFAFLNGPTAYLQSICTRDRLPFTLSYLGSIAVTLWACLGGQGYIIIVAAASCQIAALLWYASSYVPGGRAGMSLFTSMCFSTVKSAAAPCLRAVRLLPQ